MSSELTAALASAYDHPEPEDRITAIKTAVSRQLEHTDQGATIRHTEYFNSSIAPDLVVRWPSENRERPVFLRPNPSLNWFTDDLEWISPTHPLVITLGSPNEPTNTDHFEGLQRVAHRRNILVADPPAVSELSERSGEEPAASLMAQAVLRGGRGIIDEQSTRIAMTHTVDGFHGAERVDLVATRQATEVLTTLLREDQASRLSRVLQSVWEGHGGKAENFPGTRNLSGRMTDEDLHFLIVNVPTTSVDFWRRIGRGITANQIARLNLEGYSASLQVLIAANSDTLLTRGIRIFYEQSMLGEEDDNRLQWLISRRCIALRGPGWTAYVAADSVNDLPRKAKHDVPSVSELRTRADRWEVKVVNLELDVGDRFIAYSSKGDEDVLHDARLARLAQAGRTKVRRATIMIPTGGRLECDFTSLTATGHTSAIYALGDIFKSALPVLVKLDKVGATYLKLLSRAENPGPAAEQENLF
ncbi:hypothetical protein [Actinomadura fibrosa]|uniref:Uncharacterized protein n=1 Tax=Actinomadura fibrosa TaxID=111802 RepID=A0ABW2Y476_9ACTN|nr:hypothetical protein [Actinomadura fibrosa]